ncbi:MAG: sulfotransferase [Halioglobus sp.]
MPAQVFDVASRVALKMGQRRLAKDLADRAVTLEPSNFAYLSNQAVCLLAANHTTEALQLIKQLAALPHSEAAEYDALGNLYSQVNKQAEAIDCFRSAIACEPEIAHHWFNLGLCLQAVGDLADAESAFDRCIALDPAQGEPWLHRSRLRTQLADSNHVQALNSAIKKGTEDWRSEMSMRYALAKEYEDLDNYDRVFEELRLGADLRRSHMNHDPEADLAAMRAIRDIYDSQYVLAGSGYDSDEPIFIVGLPRTGTTLVERILGSHSAVYAAGELNNFAESLTSQVSAMKPKSRLDFIRMAANADSEKLGRDYVESTRPQTADRSRFIDKLPLNFLYCGLIHRALPKAKIIHLKRNAMDTCFAIYKTLFKQAYPFSYDQQELGRYYVAYRDLMAHWHHVMPGKILDVCYEDLVSDLTTQSHRLLDFCDLPWEDACLDFHQSQAPSLTASLAQVRQPVYTSSIGKWRHYEDRLKPLRAVLVEAGVKL